MRILIAIANYGTGNQNYLSQLLDTYREMPISASLVVLSNIPKDFGNDVEVRVGLPSKNPWSLPFAHRTLFRERIDEFDFFIYSEDDTLMSWNTLEAYIETIHTLKENEIAGSIRTEKSQEGNLYYSTCHSFFRWIPSSVRKRGQFLWAKYSNEHSAFFIASQQQIRKAIKSGGFPIEPHEGRHDMLCSAATDIYTSSGMDKLICIDRINDSSLQHLPNKYINKLGLSEEELGWQLEALRKIYEEKLPETELLQPETLLPGSIGSKNYREDSDPIIKNMISGDRKKRVLVWGAGDGYFESMLESRNVSVSVYPLNAVMGECCRKRGLDVLPLSLNKLSTEKEQFDIVVLRDVLHLVEEPESILDEVLSVLRKSGSIVVRVPNFYSLRITKKRLMDPNFKFKWTKDNIGATNFTILSLKKLLKKAGYQNIEYKVNLPNKQKTHNIFINCILSYFSQGLYVRARKE